MLLAMMNHNVNTGGGSGLSAPDSTSTSLLERVKAQDAEAWGRFTQIYSPLVYSWCRRFGLAAEDTGDVTQEVFRAVYSGVGRFRSDRPGDTFRGWLWTITRNKIRDHARAHQGQAEAQGGTEAQQRLQEIPDTPPDDSGSPNSSTARIAHRALELMKVDFAERTWRAFWQTAVEDRPPAEVAEAMGMSVDAVYQAKSRVLGRLRQELAGLDGD